LFEKSYLRSTRAANLSIPKNDDASEEYYDQDEDDDDEAVQSENGEDYTDEPPGMFFRMC
jgi:hypothetical protein